MADALIESDNRTDTSEPGAPERIDERSDERSPSGAHAAMTRRTDQFSAWFRSRTLTNWVTFGIVAGCVLFVFVEFQPQLLFSATTPTGGDMSAHVWGPAYLRDHLLPKGRLSGWSPDWYAGFPAFQFYMVVPFVAIALLSYVIPYGVAFKLVAVSGCVALPFACYFFGRLNKLPFPVPPLMALGGTYFLFDRSYSIYGGNIASTLAGEFCFSISLSLSIMFLAVFGAGLRTGKYRGWAALLLALTALCHLIPLFFAVAGMFAWLALRPSIAGLKYFITVGPVGVLIMFFWLGPFVGRGGYVNDMGWEKLTDFAPYLYSRTLTDSTLRNSPDLKILIWLTGIGIVLALVMRLRAALYFAVLGGIFGLGFVILGLTSLPFIGSRLWNARVLPFYYLSVYLMAFVAIGLGIHLLAKLFAGKDLSLGRALAGATAACVFLWILFLIALPMGSVPFGHTDADGTYRYGFGPFANQQTDISYLPSWIDWNFAGLESWERPITFDAAGNRIEGEPTYDRSYPEFYALVNTLKTVSDDHGCGRAMWEYEDQHNRYGSPMEPMMLPFFTDGCIGSMEGLYFEASATTPFHFINSTELSRQGSAAQRDMPYPPMPEPPQEDFDLGVEHLQMLGVKYYLAIDDWTKARAAANPALAKVTDSGPWAIYLVADSELVVPLKNEPAVLAGQSTTGKDWEHVAVCWYMHPEAFDTVLVDRGPDDWQRVARTVPRDAAASPQEQCGMNGGGPWDWFDTTGGPEERTLEPVKVTNVVTTTDSISFDVDKPGVPVVVRTSYFPNWKVSGADGVARATPNLMVVTPTSTHVELSYGWTGLDLVCYLLTFIGLALLVLLFRAKPLTVAAPSRFWWGAERPDLVAAEGAAWAAGPPPSESLPSESRPSESLPQSTPPPPPPGTVGDQPMDAGPGERHPGDQPPAGAGSIDQDPVAREPMEEPPAVPHDEIDDEPVGEVPVGEASVGEVPVGEAPAVQEPHD